MPKDQLNWRQLNRAWQRANLVPAVSRQYYQAMDQARLPQPWRHAFQLAWQSFQSDDVPVGAIIINKSGDMVASGRNLSAENLQSANQLSGSRIAHAEINALAALEPGNYASFTLVCTYQPCIICTCAIRHSRVGAIDYAAADPLWQDLSHLPDALPRLRDRWPSWRRTAPEGWDFWGALLPLLYSMQRSPHGSVERAYEAADQVLHAVAQRLVTGDAVRRWKRADMSSAMSEAAQLLTEVRES